MDFGLTAILPYILALGGILSAMFFNSGKKKAEEKSIRMEGVASREKARAEVAEETTKVIIESEKVAKDNVEKAVEIAKERRGRFAGINPSDKLR